VVGLSMGGEHYWKRFEDSYPSDYKLLNEILPIEKVKRLLTMDDPADKTLVDHYAFYNWLASFFRDAIEYGENKEKEQSSL
jgi:hypothetical protein